MRPERLNALTDGVVAIVLTIMVLELKVPEEPTFEAVLAVLPLFAAYLLAFVYVAIYWNNHHHMMHAAHQVNGKVLWYNIHLLFWLSLVPFVTSWMGENHFTTWPVALYGFVLLMAGIAYYFLAHSLVSHHGKESTFAQALGGDRKGKISVVAYIIGISLSFIHPYIGFAIYVLVAALWFIPDKRFEKKAEI